MHGKGKGGLITSLVFLILTTFFTLVSTMFVILSILGNSEDYTSALKQLLPFPICAVVTLILIIVSFVFIGHYKLVNQGSLLFLIYLTIFFSHLPYSLIWFFVTEFEDEWGFIPWHNLLIILISFIMFILLLAAKALRSRIMRLITYLISIFVFIYFMISNFSMIYALFRDYEIAGVLGNPIMYAPYLFGIEIVFFILFITSIVLTVSCSKRTYDRYNKLGFDEESAKMMLATLTVIGFQRGYYSKEIMDEEMNNLSKEQKAMVQEAIHNPDAIKYADEIFKDYRFTRDFHMMKEWFLTHL